jgi:hypothetical protein
MKKAHLRSLLIVVLVLFTVILTSASGQADVKASFLYYLANFTGTVPYSGGRVIADKERNEIYVIYENYLNIYNEHGMEIYRFGDDLDLGQILDAGVDQNGEMLLLTYKDTRSSIIRCNYRGEPYSKTELDKFPPPFSRFIPNRLVYQNGNIYLASLNEMILAVTDDQGNFKKGYDLVPLIEVEEKDRGNMEIVGFSVDGEGNILFTIPVLFKAFILSPDGKVDWFGKPGGSPGRFNVVAGIVRDSKGNYLVVDKLKSTVMVYDKAFNFLDQFGYRGLRPGNLFFPNDIAIDNRDRIYVTQGARKGISVFKLTYR